MKKRSGTAKRYTSVPYFRNLLNVFEQSPQARSRHTYVRSFLALRRRYSTSSCGELQVPVFKRCYKAIWPDTQKMCRTLGRNSLFFFFCPCDISTWNLMLGAFGLNLQREDGFETHDTTFKKWRRGGPFTVSRIHRLYFVRFQHGVRYSKRRKRGEGNCLWGLTSQFDSGYERRCNVV